MQILNQREFKDRRRELRKTQTPAEQLLWERLRNKKLNGFRFVRQFGAGPYIIDFYCPKKRLAIELDGSPHREFDRHLYDQERDHYLVGLNIQIVRFWNGEVVQNIENVLVKIASVLAMLPTPLESRGEKGELGDER